MRSRSRLARWVLAVTVLAAGAYMSAPPARAQASVDPDARRVLASMSGHLGGLNSFSVDYAAVDEVVTQDGQKLQFLHSGTITVHRPDRLHAIRRGAAGDAELFLDGRHLILSRKDAGAYLQFDASSIDSAVDVVHNFGFDAPGADLLVAKPLDGSKTDMSSGVHVGMTYIDGVKVHQLAFRGTDVDWQLWVTDGDRPLPVRYVITTKGMPGAPEFMLHLTNWNTAPPADPAQFTFVPPAGASRLDPASVTINAVGDLVIKGK